MDKMPPLFFGTGVSSYKEASDLCRVVSSALDAGIRGFDTAPSYKTEAALGECLARCASERGIARDELFVQTKIDAWQMQEGSIGRFVQEALKKMNLDYLDAVLVHWPVPEYFEDTWRKLGQIARGRGVRYIGVCNVRLRHLRRYLSLDPRPDIIQIERHPLCTMSEEAAFCKASGFALQAYSPLCKMDARIKNSEALAAIARNHQKDAGQVALRWHLETGSAPIFTSKNIERIKRYADIFSFSLSEGEIAQISSLNEGFKLYLESFACPGV